MMRKILITALVCLGLSTAALAQSQDYKRFVGKWVGPDGVFLIVEETSDFIKLKVPKSAEWRAEFKNIRVNDGRLKFEQLNFINEGHGYTFNGIVNSMELWEDNDGVMNVTVTNDMNDQVVTGAIARAED